MNRANLIALAGSVAFVLVAIWIVTLMFPAPDPSQAILGKWRVNNSPRCDDRAGYLIVTKDELQMHEEGKAHFTMFAIHDFESVGDDQRLHVYFKGKAEDFDLLVPYKIAKDKLTFGAIDWTPEARAKYPEYISQINEAAAPYDVIGLIKIWQPFTRCPTDPAP